MAKTIKVNLRNIDKAIKELSKYEISVQRHTEELLGVMSQLVRDEAQAGFTGAVADDVWDEYGGPEIAYTEVTVSGYGKHEERTVTAEGADVAFVEFGAGVWHNGPVGSSLNPLVAKNGLPYTIGSYGKGMGRLRSWTFKRGAEKVRTYGTPAAMPMYHATESYHEQLIPTAREVFSRD